MREEWKKEDDDHHGTRDAAGAEVADVLLYLIQLASALGIDPIAAAQAKLKLNAQKYPVHLARGSSAKYDQL